MLKTCAKCKTPKPITEFWTDKRHIDKRRSRCVPCLREGRRESAIRNRPQRKAYAKLWRQKNPERAQLQLMGIRRRLREKVIAGYGGKCTCCGEPNFEFLGLEHLNNDGKAHRDERGGTHATWRDVVARGFPDAYTVLCMNCNHAKARLGICPHIFIAQAARYAALATMGREEER